MFEKIFYDLVEDINKVDKVDEGYHLLVEAAQKYNLLHVAYLGINVPGLTDNGPYGSVTYSNEWVQHYDQSGFVNVDPVVRSGLTSLLPLDWGAVNRDDPKLQRFFGEAEDAGVGKQGLSFTIRGTNNELALFSINSDASDNEWSDIKRIYMRDFQVIAHYVHSMVLRTTGVKKVDYASVLSDKERECLQWAAVGKSTWETSVILGMSERSVKFYLDQARHKLDCLNKTHAVAKALALGLVVPGG